MKESKLSVLVVDDDMLIREVIEAHLELMNYTVFLAHNGLTALKQAAEHTPDLILLDARMDDMSGFEVCRKLKTNGVTQYIPVIMLTGLQSETDRRRGLDSGAQAFLTKPFDSATFLELVKTLLTDAHSGD